MIEKILMLISMSLMMTAAVLSAAGTGSVNQVSGWYPAGTILTIQATPDVYSQFERWSGDTNGTDMAANQISFSVDGPRSISAVFKEGLTDSNAVPYAWLGGQNPAWTNDFEAAASGDPDGDGFTTAEEYWSGTDPQDGDSLLLIDGVSVSGTNVVLVWRHAQVDAAIPDVVIQCCTDLASGGWNNVGQKAPANGTNSWTAGISPGAYYRLVVTAAQ